jgi:VCBS repeat protein
VVGTGDFNGDGQANILLQNTATGGVYVWYMSGAAIAAGMFITTDEPLAWKVVGIADFNRDGKVDILWRNASTSENRVWLMDGAALRSSSTIGPPVADTNWKIVGPR